MTTHDSEPKPPRKRASRKKPETTYLIQALYAQHGLRVESAEGLEELRSRLSIEEAKAAHEIWRDRLILCRCLFAVPILVVACLLVLLLPGGPVEPRTWAASTLTAIVTGIVGYSLGKSGKGS